jgi:hypothetical protein
MNSHFVHPNNNYSNRGEDTKQSACCKVMWLLTLLGITSCPLAPRFVVHKLDTTGVSHVFSGK